MKTAAEMERDELLGDTLTHLQTVRFAIEAIVARPDKVEFTQSRASMAEKTLRRIEQNVRKLFELPVSTKVNPNDHLGAESEANHCGRTGS